MSDERKDILYVFDELVTNATKFNNPRWQKERDEAYQQIRQIIEQKPGIDKEYIKAKAIEIYNLQYYVDFKIEQVEDILNKFVSDMRRKQREVSEGFIRDWTDKLFSQYRISIGVKDYVENLLKEAGVKIIKDVRGEGK